MMEWMKALTYEMRLKECNVQLCEAALSVSASGLKTPKEEFAGQ